MGLSISRKPFCFLELEFAGKEGIFNTEFAEELGVELHGVFFMG